MTASRIFIDTNPLVLLFVGSASADCIAAHRRTRAYTIEDFALLQILVGDTPVFVTTPNVLAEASNLIRQFDASRLAPVLDAFSSFAATAVEAYVPSAEGVRARDFRRLGLNDVTVLAAQDMDVTLITDDLGLYLVSASAGRKALHFAHERERMRR